MTRSQSPPARRVSVPSGYAVNRQGIACPIYRTVSPVSRIVVRVQLTVEVER